MRTKIIGLEFSEGVGGKSGKAYSIAQLHCISPLAPAMGDTGIAVGSMGSTFRVEPEMVKGLQARMKAGGEFLADLTLEVVMKFGKPETVVKEVAPVAAPGAK